MLVTPEQMQKLEAITDRSGITYGHMMERAGKALADIITEGEAWITELSDDELRDLLALSAAAKGGA